MLHLFFYPLDLIKHLFFRYEVFWISLPSVKKLVSLQLKRQSVRKSNCFSYRLCEQILRLRNYIWYCDLVHKDTQFFFYETVSQNRQVLILDCCKFQQMPSTAPQFSSHQKLLPRQRLKWSNRHQPQQKPRNMPSFWTKDPPTQQRNLAHSSAKWCPTLLVCCLTKVKKGNEGWNIIGYCNIGWAEVGENNLWVSRYFSTHFSKDWSDQLDRYCRSARKH